MASRIGKYKVSKRESAVSLIDGGTATGKVKLNGNTGLVAGSGFGDAALYKSWSQDLGGITKIPNSLIIYT